MVKAEEISQVDKCKDDIIKRLNRIEGQVKGIQKMINEEKCCSDVLIQIAAVKAAINKVGGMVLENHSKACIKAAIENGNGEQAVEELIQTMQKFMKYIE